MRRWKSVLEGNGNHSWPWMPTFSHSRKRMVVSRLLHQLVRLNGTVMNVATAADLCLLSWFFVLAEVEGELSLLRHLFDPRGYGHHHRMLWEMCGLSGVLAYSRDFHVIVNMIPFDCFFSNSRTDWRGHPRLSGSWFVASDKWRAGTISMCLHPCMLALMPTRGKDHHRWYRNDFRASSPSCSNMYVIWKVFNNLYLDCLCACWNFNFNGCASHNTSPILSSPFALSSSMEFDFSWLLVWERRREWTCSILTKFWSRNLCFCITENY